MARRAKPGHGGARPGAGRKARADGVSSPTLSLRLGANERECLRALARLLGGTEADVLRRALAELAERHLAD